MNPPPTMTVVGAKAALLVSLPSGITLSGSTTAELAYGPGIADEKALTVMVRNAGSPTTRWSVPLKAAPVQLIAFPEPGMQVNRSASLGGAVSAAEMNVKPAGSVSVNLTLKAGSVPELVTTIW